MPSYAVEDDVPWFNDRSKINKVVIEYGVTSIGSRVFHLCLRLTSITIPNSVTSIGDYAFKNCNITSITIPNSVTSIGEKVFMDNLRLTSIIVEKDNPKYDSRDNCNAIIETKSNTLIAGCKNTVIPSSVTSIGGYAFFGSELTSITIPNSVKSIGDYAFGGCSDLTSITFKRTSPPEFGKEVFYIVNTSIPIYVPSISIDAYKEALKDFGFSNIQANPKQLFLAGNSFYLQDLQIDGADVSFTRDFTTNWEAIYLPFSLKYEDWKDDFEVARINGIRQYDDYNIGSINRTELEVVKMTNDDSVIYPNTPYLIRAKTPGEKTLSIENTTLYESKANSIECSTTTEQFTFIGLYKKPSLLSIGQLAIGENYVMYEGNLSKLTTQSNIGPYRWYMKRENRNSVYGINNNNTAKEISIRVVGEETTGIANIQHTSPNTQTYDLNGRRVNENNLKPGMYVKNGRKFVVK